MKRVVSGILLLLLLSLSAACALPSSGLLETQTAAPESSTASESSTALESSTASSAASETTVPPETTAAHRTPMELFGSGCNPCAGWELPDIFTVFSAAYNRGSEKTSGKDQFVLSMTGSGNMYACIAYLADTAGLGLDDGKKMELLEEYRANGCFCEFTGADGQVVTIRQANPDDDRYAYVEADGSHGFTGGGCVVDLTYFIDDGDATAYVELVRDNYRLEALKALSPYMEIETDFAECGIGVNLHKQQAAAYVVYYLSDTASVMKRMEDGLQEGWWEYSGMQQTSIQYGALDSKLTFDNKANAVTIEQTNRNFTTDEAQQTESAVSLKKLGFQFDDAGICGVFEEREPHYRSVAIHRPEWGDFDGGWNMEYLDEADGYLLQITFHAAEGKYRVSLEKDGKSCSYETYPEKEQVGWEYPDLDTVHRMFHDALGTVDKELYDQPLADFEQMVQTHFGMSAEELYALPAE